MKNLTQIIIIIINKYSIILRTYVLILFGLIITSFMLYNKFVRERLPKDIPIILNDYRFWILVYLCCMYIFVLKKLIKVTNKKPDEVFLQIIEIIYTPLTTLDHVIKYNKYFKENYYIFMDNLIKFLNKCKDPQLEIIIIWFQIIPRIILVSLLLRDIFYFQYIEIFYKYLLIGLIPFFHRYIKYSIKDIKDYYISQIELKCNSVYLWDLAFNDLENEWKLTEANKYHQKDVPIKEYVEYETNQQLYKTNDVKYNIDLIIKIDVCKEYKKQHNISDEIDLTEEDFDILQKEDLDFLNKVLKINVFLEIYSNVNNMLFIRILKIIVFGGYLICWLYVLIISYYYYPLMFQLTFEILKKMLERINEHFSNLFL